MAQNFLSCDREQELLLPPSLRDWLAGDHLAWFVLDAVGAVDLSGVYGEYREDGWGRAAHEPGMMVALLLYAYAVGERSSRRIERRCREDVAFRVVCANRVPDHTTIARFRARHERALAGLFVQVLELCARAGLVSVGLVALDGSKLHANASLSETRSYASIREEVERILGEAAAVDAAEDEQFGDARGDELPPELADPASRRARLERCRRELEAEHAQRQAAFDELEQKRARKAAQTGKKPVGRPPIPPKPGALERSKANVTDPDSRIVRHRGGLIQGYNPQVVASPEQVIIAAEVTNHERDANQLRPMLQAAREALQNAGVEGEIATVLADGGYWNNAAITETQAEGVEVLIPLRKRAPPKGPHAQRIQTQLDSDAGKRLYERRKQIVEPVFAHIKHIRGINRFTRRGLAAADAEWKLIATTHNLLKLWRAAPHPA